MAIIGKIRSYSGLLIIIIGVALLAFVLGDFVKKGPKGNGNEFARIAGEDISINDFQNKVQEQEAMYMERLGQENLTTEQHNQVRTQAWNDLLRNTIFNKEFDKIGITVTPSELLDLVNGNDPSQIIRQTFTNPQTGQVDRVRINQIIQSEGQMDAKMQVQWDYLKEQIRLERLFTKYTSLITKAYYTPKALAKLDYEQKNNKAVVRFVSLKYATITDDKVKVTDDDLNTYYNNHKYEFNNQEALRSLDYISIEVQPSTSDLVKAQAEIAKIRAEFETTTDVAEYVNSVSEKRYDSTYMKKGDLPVRFDTLMFAAKIGSIVGPLVEGNMNYMAKLVNRMARPDSLKAKHILIAYQDALRADPNIKRTKAAAKKLADSLRIIVSKDTNVFKALAAKYSDDPAVKQNNGDYGWFKDGQMVTEFTNACINGAIGSVVIAETPFGFHVINITGKTKSIEKVRVATIELSITPSNATTDSVRKLASVFEAQNRTAEAIEKAGIKLGLNKRVADQVKDMDNELSGLPNSREIVRWSFNEEIKKGDIKLFELVGEPTRYVIAVLKDKREKGILPLNQVKADIEPKVKAEKKAIEITKKLNDALAQSKDINVVAGKLALKVDSSDYITFSSYSMPGAGPEPKVIARIFSMKPGSISEPIQGKAGVYVVQVDRIQLPTEKPDYTTAALQIARYFQNRINYDILNVLKKTADVVDNRRLFF